MVNLIRGRRLISLSNSARALSRLLPANSMRSIFVLSSVQSSTSLAMADPEYLPLRETLGSHMLSETRLSISKQPG